VYNSTHSSLQAYVRSGLLFIGPPCIGYDTLTSRYEAGFTACVAEVGRYFSSIDVVPQLSSLLPHLVNHLATCLSHRRRCDVTRAPAETGEAFVERHSRHTPAQNGRRLPRRPLSYDNAECSFLQEANLLLHWNRFTFEILTSPMAPSNTHKTEKIIRRMKDKNKTIDVRRGKT